ncbi:hypothetical protein BC830DRAFT_1102162 [Chytriomyces sp. MP71]|nr:hypothetical protein BC830DRAFT_1102162 [Chytriomyces sp. MP71]
MTMCLSLLAVYLCYMIQVGFNTDSSLAWIMSFFLDFFSATFELAYIKYSWTRASCVIAGCVNSITLHIITIFVKFCPFILYAQTVPALFDAIAAHYSSLHPYITTASVVEQTLSGLAGIIE